MAVDLLRDRYGNKQVIISSHLDSLLKLPRVTQASDIKGIRIVSLYSLISHLQKMNANYYEAQNDSPKTRLTCGLVVGFRILSLLFQHEVSLLVRIFPLSTQKKVPDVSPHSGRCNVRSFPTLGIKSEMCMEAC